jgi:N-acetylneuraminic acid mutarotase
MLYVDGARDRPMSVGSISPFARRSASACFHQGEFYIFGGFGTNGSVDPGAVFSDLWRFGDDGWSLCSSDIGFGARYTALFTDASTLWRFGGCGWDGQNITFEDRLWSLSTNKNCWAAVSPMAGDERPTGRYTAAAFVYAGSIYVFGGHHQNSAKEKTNFGDLWRYSDGHWICLHGSSMGPGPNYGFGWCVAEDYLYVATGFDGVRDRSDLWRLDLAQTALENPQWQLLSADGPPSRYCPALGHVAGALVLFGGRRKTDAKCNYSDTWLFDLSKARWQLFEGPGPGYHAKMGYASDGSQLMVFGGEGERGHVSDLWSFDGDQWREIHKGRDDDPILW